MTSPKDPSLDTDQNANQGSHPSRLAWLPVFDWRQAVILTWAALALVIVYYQHTFTWLGERQQLFGWFGLNFVLLLIVPLLIIRFVLREPLRDYGLCRGRFDIWGKYLLVFAVVFIPIAALASRLPQFNFYYPRYFWARQQHWLLIPSIIGWGFYFLAWEFFFRGFLLMGLGKRLGPIAIFIQMVPFAMAHIGKPELEACSAIIAGLALGLMAWRGKSFVGTWLLHWLAATSMDVFVVFWPLH